MIEPPDISEEKFMRDLKAAAEERGMRGPNVDVLIELAAKELRRSAKILEESLKLLLERP